MFQRDQKVSHLLLILLASFYSPCNTILCGMTDILASIEMYNLHVLGPYHIPGSHLNKMQNLQHGLSAAELSWHCNFVSIIDVFLRHSIIFITMITVCLQYIENFSLVSTLCPPHQIEWLKKLQSKHIMMAECIVSARNILMSCDIDILYCLL